MNNHKVTNAHCCTRKHFFVKLPVFLPLWLTSLLFIAGCNKEKWFDGPNYMQEDFESYAHPDSMFSHDDVRWSYHQNTMDGNYIAFDTNIVHAGNRSLKFFAVPSNDIVSKNSIVKQQMAFYEGDVVRISAWYYIEGTANLDWIFLFDFEEQAAIGAGPGIRIANSERHIVLEHKYLADDLYQEEGQEIPLPRNQWFNLTMEVKLSQKKKGYVKIWQDNVEIINADKQKTLPTDFLYSQQGTKGMYQSIEFGITANTKNNSAVMYVDDIIVEKIN